MLILHRYRWRSALAPHMERTESWFGVLGPLCTVMLGDDGGNDRVVNVLDEIGEEEGIGDEDAEVAGDEGAAHGLLHLCALRQG